MLDVPSFSDVSELRKEVGNLKDEIRRLKKVIQARDKTIHRLRKACGIKMRVGKMQVIAMVEGGHTNKEIMESLGVHRSTIFKAKQLIKKP